MIQDHKADINARDDQNNTPLHVAAWCGKKDVIFLLINKFSCDANSRGYNGYSLLHSACYNNQSNLLKLLCDFLILSPCISDVNGNTPLHICSARGNEKCVKVLLELNAPVMIRNKTGKTPKDVAKNNGHHYLTPIFDEHFKRNKDKMLVDYISMQECAKRRYSDAQHITRLFITGFSGAGKSSLVESLKREGILDYFWKVSESTVPPHTAGIIPSTHISKYYGRVQFYDFAGNPEYYSSHAAILENLAFLTKGDNIFLIVIDLRDDDAIEKALHYWYTFMQYQKFKERPSLIVIGSHSDLVTKSVLTKNSRVIQQFLKNISPRKVKSTAHFMLDCCQPRSRGIGKVQKQLINLTSKSPRYSLSFEASILLGLLEKDFSKFTACSVSTPINQNINQTTTLLSHIKDTGVHLPKKAELLHPMLHELHEVGILLLISDRTKLSDSYLILKISELTNTVHKALFSENALQDFKKSPMYSNIGILSEDLLKKILPSNITKKCLIHLQYCQEIKHKDLDLFLSPPQDTSQSFLFFPALCSVDKSEVSWTTPPDSYSIGWLAQCTDPYDYFPIRFLHVLLLRIVFRFTLTSPGKAVDEHSKHFQRRCTMWKTGVHWLMEEGVECMVEMVKIDKQGQPGVVVITKSEQDAVENCISIFNNIVSCVMETKANFCHSIGLQFFLFDFTKEDDYLSEDNLFAISDVERVLTEGKREIISITGKRKIKRSKLLCMRKLTHWDSLFPIEFITILQILKNLVKKMYDLGLELSIPQGVLDAIEEDHPTDTERRRRELVKGWINYSLDPPCWWHLAEALRKIDMGALANEIEEKYSKSIYKGY